MYRYLLVAAAAGLTTSLAGADSPVLPYSYAKTSADGRFIFVMLPDPAHEHLKRWEEEFQARARAVREKYPRSGLYRNDGSVTPLWTVDWYALSVDVASDGVHLVRHGPWPGKGRYDTEAVSFFANGRLLKTYEVRHLMRSPERLPKSASHYEWLEDSSFSDQEMKLRLRTKGGEHYTFDVRTGEIVHEPPDPSQQTVEGLDRWRDGPRWAVVLHGLLVVAGITLLVVVAYRLTRPRVGGPAPR